MTEITALELKKSGSRFRILIAVKVLAVLCDENNEYL